MIFDEVCSLPNATPVRLLDGRIGRMAIWHKHQETVGVVVPDGSLQTLSAAQLRLVPDGSCEEVVCRLTRKGERAAVTRWQRRTEARP